MTRIPPAALACGFALAVSKPVAAQEALILGPAGAQVSLVQVGPATAPASGRLSDVVFANAPFSADAVTTVTQTLADGTKIEHRTTSKWYRDSSGRVRREQSVIGLDRLNSSSQPQTTITFDSVPGDPQPYTLFPATRTARRAPRGVQWLTSGGAASLWLAGANGGYVLRQPGVIINTPTVMTGDQSSTFTIRNLQTAPVPSDLKPTEENLGTRQVEGVKATGRRRTTVIPAGRIGNDRPIQIVEEQWDAPELNMVVLSRFSDPRTGVVEYRLTNINRAEPSADLFTVPADYTVADPAGFYRDALTPRPPLPARQPLPAPRGN
jgi:hypothetical protein